MRLPIKQVWHLGLPLSLGFVIQMIIVMVDSAFAGKISYIALAAVAMAGSAYYILFLLMVGFAVASSVQAGQALGADDQEGMINSFRKGTLICLSSGFILALLLLGIEPIMHLLGQEPEVIAQAMIYLPWVAWTIPLQGLVILGRDYFAVIDTPWRSVLPIFFALLLNAFLDYVLATGELGFPALGIAGIGIASLISNVAMVVLMFRNIGWNITKQFFAFGHREVWRNKGVQKLALIGLPIALTLAIEEIYFSGTILLAGTLGAAEQAAHQILFNLIGTSFLFNTGIGVACAIIIGKYIGAKEFDKIYPTVKAGWVICFLFTLPFGLIVLLMSDQWIGLYLDHTIAGNGPTIVFVKSVLLLTFTLLFADVIWLVVVESLHGMLDTTYPAICAFIAYWLVGGPMAIWATGHFPDAFIWIWISLLVSVALLTVLVFQRLKTKLREFEQQAKIS